MIELLPEFPFDPAPRSSTCDNCGASNELRFVILRGRTRYLGRTLCDLCAEEVLEAMIAVGAPGDRANRE